MAEKYNTISFCRSTYEDDKKEINEYSLFEDLTDFIRIAIKNEYQMKIFDDGLTIVVEYNYAEGSLSGVSLEWIGENEYISKYGEQYEDE